MSQKNCKSFLFLKIFLKNNYCWIKVSGKADKLLIGGAVANTFLATQGYQTGRSLVERDLFPKVVELLAIIKDFGIKSSAQY